MKIFRPRSLAPKGCDHPPLLSSMQGAEAEGDLEPNFIATLNAEELKAAIERPGWHVF